MKIADEPPVVVVSPVEVSSALVVLASPVVDGLVVFAASVAEEDDGDVEDGGDELSVGSVVDPVVAPLDVIVVTTFSSPLSQPPSRATRVRYRVH